MAFSQFWSFAGADNACSGRVVGEVGGARGGVFGIVEVDSGEIGRLPSCHNVGVKRVCPRVRASVPRGSLWNIVKHTVETQSSHCGHSGKIGTNVNSPPQECGRQGWTRSGAPGTGSEEHGDQLGVAVHGSVVQRRRS